MENVFTYHYQKTRVEVMNTYVSNSLFRGKKMLMMGVGNILLCLPLVLFMMKANPTDAELDAGIYLIIGTVVANILFSSLMIGLSFYKGWKSWERIPENERDAIHEYNFYKDHYEEVVNGNVHKVYYRDVYQFKMMDDTLFVYEDREHGIMIPYRSDSYDKKEIDRLIEVYREATK